MKLIAVKRISKERPIGTVFEESPKVARLLIAIKRAKPYVEPPKAQKPEPVPEPAPVHVAHPDQEPETIGYWQPDETKPSVESKTTVTVTPQSPKAPDSNLSQGRSRGRSSRG